MHSYINASIKLKKGETRFNCNVAYTSKQKHTFKYHLSIVPSPGVPECTGENQYQCDDGRCLPASYRCDGEYDCGYGDDSDEEGCGGKGMA